MTTPREIYGREVLPDRCVALPTQEQARTYLQTARQCPVCRTILTALGWPAAADPRVPLAMLPLDELTSAARASADFQTRLQMALPALAQDPAVPEPVRRFLTAYLAAEENGEN